MNDRQPDRRLPSPWVYGALAGFTFLIGYLRSFILPNVPTLAWGDALGYATKGARIFEGELPYRDFFDFVTPGTQLVYALLFRWVGVSLWVPNLLMCLMAAATTLWVTWCARRLVPGSLVLVPGLLITGFTLYGSFDPTHHWFCTVIVMAAVATLFDGVSAGRVITAGALCGLAASFTQSAGAVAVVALLVFLWLRSHRNADERSLYRRRSLQLCGTALVVFAAINIPFIVAAGPQRWFADVIVFPLRYFGTVSPNNWHGTVAEFGEKRSGLKWVCPLFIYLAVPVSYIWTLMELWKKRLDGREKYWDQLLLLALVGGAMLVAVGSGPSVRRISCASPPAMILLVWLLGRRGKLWQNAARVLAAVSVAVACEQAGSVQFHYNEKILLPAGYVAILDAGNAEVYRWMKNRTHPGQWYFGMPPYTLPLRLRNPTAIESPSQGDYYRPEQIASVIAGLERTQTEMLLLRPSIYVPHLLGYQVDYLQPFHDYVLKYYRCKKVFPTGDEVWQRIDSSASGTP